MRDAWTEVCAVLSAADFAETKDMAALPGPIIRSLTKGDLQAMKQIFYVSICTHVFFLAVLEEGNSAPSEPNPSFSAKGRRASFFMDVHCPSRCITHQLQARVRSPRTVVTQQRDVEMHTLRLHRYVVAMQKKWSAPCGRRTARHSPRTNCPGLGSGCTCCVKP